MPEVLLVDTCAMIPKGPKAQRDAAASPATDSYVLGQLAQSKLGFVRREVAANPNTPPTVLGGLMPATFNDNADQEIALALAGNPNSDERVLADLCRRLRPILDNGRSNRAGFSAGVVLASNPSTPFEALREMLNQDRTAIQFRKVVARETNRHDVLELLLEDRSERVRRRAEQNQL